MIDPRHIRAAKRALRIPDAVARRARRRYARVAARHGAGLILFYHRIADPPYDPWQIAVSPATFDSQLRLLTSEYRVLPLAELFAAARRGRIPERAVALTFDDGYVDNLERGLPLLEKYEAPATIYIVTGYVGQARRFWWDELQDLAIGHGERPSTLSLSLGKAQVVARTATAADRRRTLMSVLHPAFRASPPAVIESGLEGMRAWAKSGGGGGGEVGGGDDSGRPMTGDELGRLQESDLIELGAHTASHPSMLALTRRLAEGEVESSRRFLAELTGAYPSSFSFPFGENSPTSRRIVRSCGFDNAVGVQGTVPLTAAARRFELPRVMAVEETEEALAARMERTLAFRE